MRFGTQVVTGLTAALVIALAGAQAVSAGTLAAGRYPVNAPAAGTGAPLAFQAGAGSSNTLPLRLYPAPVPARGKGAPLVFPAGVRSSNTVAQGFEVCYKKTGFKSVANGDYVAAELDYGVRYPKHNGYGMLRARAHHLGKWEEFEFCYDRANNAWSIRSEANDKWVVTQMDYPNPDKYMLRAHAAAIGPWERYHMYCVQGDPTKFEIYSLASKRYVAAELNYTGKDKGMLRARSDRPGPWEEFSGFPPCGG